MQSEIHDRLIPEIHPRAEPASTFADNTGAGYGLSGGGSGFGNSDSDAATAFGSNSERTDRFYRSRSRDSFTSNASERSFIGNDRGYGSGFDSRNGDGFNNRSSRNLRPGRLMEADGDFTRRFFQEEDTGMVSNGMSHRRQRRQFANFAASAALRSAYASSESGYDNGDSNAGVQAASDAEHLASLGAEDMLIRSADRLRIRRAEKFRQAQLMNDRLIFDGINSTGVNTESATSESRRRSRIRRYYQKRRYKRMYADRRCAEEKNRAAFNESVRLSTRIKAAFKQLFSSNKKTLLVMGVILLMCFLMMAAVSSCAASIHGLTSALLATTYPSTDEDIHAVEDAYAAMEARLNAQISNMETTHPGYDEYLYQVDEISHNPYHLISYFTTKYGQFTYEQVKDELEEIFHQQYSISTSTGSHEVTETVTQMVEGEEIETEETKTVTTFNITMTNNDLDEVLRARMTSDEQAQYKILNATYGNRDYLFDLDSLTTYSPRGIGRTYQIPPEALSDKRFARMIHEAEKYLGYPYVWGGSNPSQSFDCSGFVSWVINHCGNGWNVGRLGAEGLRQRCVEVSPSNAKPGDLIFFQHTYPCGPGASHVGIYVGNGMMIHCGNPIQYTSIKSAYWQQHFLSFGRIKG